MKQLHHPVHYVLADHAAKIFRSPAYVEAAKTVGISPNEFQKAVAAEFKRLTAEQAAKELLEYEKALGAAAITAAIDKAKAAA
jgi:hypothetical protein